MADRIKDKYFNKSLDKHHLNRSYLVEKRLLLSLLAVPRRHKSTHHQIQIG